MDDCTTCKRYRESLKRGRIITCFKAEYYTPGMIFYCRPQMLWLIQHLNFLEDGYWVPNQKESGYTNAPIGKGNVPDEAYFCKVKVITGDLTLRLKRTKEDSRTLVHEIQKLGVEVYEDLSPAAKVALNYISGWRRRKTSYKDFKARVR